MKLINNVKDKNIFWMVFALAAVGLVLILISGSFFSVPWLRAGPGIDGHCCVSMDGVPPPPAWECRWHTGVIDYNEIGCVAPNCFLSPAEGGIPYPCSSCYMGVCGAIPPAPCGNGVVQPPAEQCDDGNTTSGDGCSATCQNEIIVPVCGNDIVEPPEECEASDTSGCETDELCNNVTCQCVAEPAAFCGNEVIEPPEQCDDGNDDDTDGCVDCYMEANCGLCGNGEVGSNEECDDGNRTSGDGCDRYCQNEGTSAGCGGVTCGANQVCCGITGSYPPSYICQTIPGLGGACGSTTCESDEVCCGATTAPTCVNACSGYCTI